MFDINKPVEGNLIIEPSDGGSVWQYGINLEVYATVCYLDRFQGESKLILSKNVYGKGYIKERTRIPFQLDPKETIDGNRINENYCGELLLLSHSFKVSVKRPWYTFDVIVYKNIAFQDISPCPCDTDIENCLIYQTLVRNVGPLSLQTEIKLNDLDVSESCSFSLNKLCYNIGDSVSGKLKVKVSHPKNMKDLVLSFCKRETGDQEMKETVLLEKSLTSKMSLHSESVDKTISDVFKLSDFNAHASIHNPLSTYLLVPTFYDTTFKDGPIGLRYFLTLTLHTINKTHSSRCEIFLFRDHFEGRIKITDDTV